ncbi:hypothetical protein [Streptomyces sp. NPDC051286]|uniref:hypothetical protein n=1 Tax=Streptomyces sp. NPDC051286 TaxID=3365647 RepID=UPI00379ED073
MASSAAHYYFPNRDSRPARAAAGRAAGRRNRTDIRETRVTEDRNPPLQVMFIPLSEKMRRLPSSLAELWRSSAKLTYSQIKTLHHHGLPGRPLPGRLGTTCHFVHF